MHCGPDICTAGLSVMISPGPQAINQLLGSGLVYALGRCAPSGLVRVYQPDPSMGFYQSVGRRSM